MLKTCITATILLVIAVTSCNKTVDTPPKNDVQLKTSIALENYYSFSSLVEVWAVFQDRGYTLDDIQYMTNELDEYALSEDITFNAFELELFKEGTYNFVSTSSDNLFKVSYVLENDADHYRVVGTSCTCTGCSDGCSPRRKTNGDCYCTVCTFVGSGVKCTKSESLSVGGMD